MIPWLLLSIGAPLALGLLLIRMAWQPRLTLRAGLLQLTLACGLGIGISSCTFFLYMAKVQPAGPRLAFVEPALFLCVIAVCLAFGRTRRSLRAKPVAGPSTLPPFPGSPDTIPKPLLIGVCAVLACAVAGLILVSINKPHGGGDALGIWNMRARFMFRGHELWTRGFSRMIAWSHPDYPLLIPSSIARLWTYIGFDTHRVPQVLSGFFTFATVAALSSSLAVLRSARHAVEAALFLLATAYFVRLGGDQYADIPMGFFILSTAVLLTLSEATAGTEESRGLLSLAGLTAGFAAWTKNEGMLFVLAAVVALAATTLSKRGFRDSVRTLGFFLFGLIPVLLVILYFKVRYAPPNDLFGSHDLGPFLARLRDSHRYALIARAFGNELLRWGNGLTAVFVIYLVARGVTSRRPHPTFVSAGFIALVLMFVGYFFVYVLTPMDLIWHLGTSLERLLLQMWPTFLFLLFLVIGPAEE